MKRIKSLKEFKDAKKLNENVDEFLGTKTEVTEDQFVDMIDVFRDKDMMINDEVLLKKAREDQFKGDLKPVKSKKSGQVVLIYRPSINIGSSMAPATSESTDELKDVSHAETIFKELQTHKDSESITLKDVEEFLVQFREGNPNLKDEEIGDSDFYEWWEH